MNSLGQRILLLVLWCLCCILVVALGVSKVQLGSPEPVEAWLKLNPSQHPLLQGWQVLFGTSLSVARWFSALWLALALAFVARLGNDLGGSTSGLYAVLLLGLTGFWLGYAVQGTPFIVGVSAIVGVVWSFWRWLRRPHLAYALLFTLCAVVSALVSPVALLFLAGQAAYGCFYTRRRTALILLGVNALLVVPLALLWAGQQTVIAWWSLSSQVGVTLIIPQTLQLLALVGLSAGSYRHLPKPPYLVVIGLSVMVANRLLVEEAAQFMLILTVLPLVSLLAGQTLRLLMWPVRLLLLLIMLGLVLIAGRSGSSYADAARHATPDTFHSTGLVITAPEAWQHSVIDQYMAFSDSNQFHLLMPGMESTFASQATGEEALPIFMDWANRYDRIWYIKDGGVGFDEPFRNWLNQGFAETATTDWFGILSPPPNEPRTMTLYQRIPPDLGVLYHLGSSFQLAGWQYRDDINVQPCQAVTLESWWRIAEAVTMNYTLTLVLADAQGQGIIRSDSAPAEIDTLVWQPERPYYDVRTLTLPCDLSPGEYSLLIGMYSTVDGEFKDLMVSTAAGAALGNRVYLTTLFVRPS